MGRAVAVTLGTEAFRKKGEVETRMRTMVASYPLMEFLTGDDLALSLELFKHHPEYGRKLGSGIKAVQIRLDEYGNRYLHIHRFDGSDEDISWRYCLSSIR